MGLNSIISASCLELAESPDVCRLIRVRKIWEGSSIEFTAPFTPCDGVESASLAGATELLVFGSASGSRCVAGDDVVSVDSVDSVDFVDSVAALAEISH